MNKFLIRFILISAIAGGINWNIGHNLPPQIGPRFYTFSNQASLSIALILSEIFIISCSGILKINKGRNQNLLKTKLEDALRELPAGHPDCMRLIELIASLDENSPVDHR